MARRISTNDSFESSHLDAGSQCSDHATGADLNGVEEYNKDYKNYKDDYDGDSITDYDGTDLDVESQHNRLEKKLLPPPSNEAEKTHHVEFDPLALGRQSSATKSKESSGKEDDQSSSGKNSVTSFSEKTGCELTKTKKEKNKTGNSKVKNIVRGETRRIKRWKLASIIVVAFVGFFATAYVFLSVFESQRKANEELMSESSISKLFYRSVFNFEDTANHHFRQSVRGLEEISRALTERANSDMTFMDVDQETTQTSFPFVTLPSFPEMAQELNELGMIDGKGKDKIMVNNIAHHQLYERVFWAPIVDPPSKDDWESYSFYNQGWIMDAGTDLMKDDGGKQQQMEIELDDDLFYNKPAADAVWLEEMEEKEYPTPDQMPIKISPEIHSDLLDHGDTKNKYRSDMTMTTRFQFTSDPGVKTGLTYLPAWQCFDFDNYEKSNSDTSSISGTDKRDQQPVCDVSFVNFDLFSWFSPASTAIGKGRTVIMDDDNLDADDLEDGIAHMWNDRPFCDDHEDDGSDCETSVYLRVPVYDSVSTQKVAGYVIAVLKEEVGFFRDSSLKFSTETYPLRLVIKEERNGRSKTARIRKRTYEVSGSKIVFVGDGDLHDKEYTDWVYKFKLRSLSEKSTSSTQYFLYPTSDIFQYYEALHQRDRKDNPMMNLSEKYAFVPAIWTSSLVASVFAVILIIFVCYDNSVEDRQRKLLRQAERTDAIVGSMFPANIQGRLMMIDDDTIESSHRQRGVLMQKEGNFPPVLTGFDASAQNAAVPDTSTNATTPITNGSMHSTVNDSIPNNSSKGPPFTRMGKKVLANRSRNQNPMASPAGFGELKTAPSGVDESILRFGNTKPMADFYPNTTILMCDIAGFTAWSSARAPADVFRLLETIYGAFDDIARAEKVFKVETVGDCYVACAGLPVRQPKHAVIMAKFAKKVLKRYDTLIKKLETYLGPDTVDLGLRIGIHSGPVTAGVLRGDKTRFQLFGDTVNTSSRMESTGRVNMIQVSPQTANLLKDEGLGKWVIPRENLVTVKGKGEMQTYWLLRSGSSMSSQLSQPSLPSPMGSPKMGVKSSNMLWKMNGGHSGQPRRNSMGASNASWETSSTGTQSSGSVQSHPQRRYSNSENAARNSKERRLIEWMVETFMKSLKKITTHRNRSNKELKPEDFLHGKELSNPLLDPESQIIEEIKEVIPIRKESTDSSGDEFNRTSGDDGNVHVVITRAVERQLRDFITVVSLLYHDHAFHNFEHCAHVLMSVMKLLSRILESKLSASDNWGDGGGGGGVGVGEFDDHAYGITSDPLLEFSCLFSALIHDVDHSGVPNSQLVKENTTTASRYNNRSVAEQHSIAVAWSLLMQPCYRELRECIYRTQSEFDRFRQLVVNSVMATDIMDRDLKKFRDNRWEKAFDLKNDLGVVPQCTENANRMATVVIEHMIQASDVAHTMQHWHVYLKFNERLFKEMYQAYKDGRAEKDPSEYWYEGELNFFKFYIIPLALKLKECGVFGVSGDEYFFHAESNRSEWALKGKEIVADYMGRASRDSSRNSSRSSSPNPNPLLAKQLLKLPEGKASSFSGGSPLKNPLA